MRWLKIGAVILFLPLIVAAALVAGPIVGVVWGVRQFLPSRVPAGRRGRGGTAIVVSAVFALVAWPVLAAGLGGTGETQAAAPTPQATPTSATASATSASSTPAATSPTTPPARAGLPSPTGAGRGTPGLQTSASRGGALTGAAPTRTSPDPSRAVDSPGLWPVVGITDGDTIRVRVDGTTQRIRVIGIDTPELAQRECFAREAASAMQSLAQSRWVRLEVDPTQADRDRYGRLLRHVVLPDGRLAAQVLIAGGFGREYTYAADYVHQAAFRSAESSARNAGLGVWSSGCAQRSAPSPSPTANRVAATPKRVAAAPPGSCDIKGNISTAREKIYHVPGGRSYGSTKISPGKGERWFCSESQASAAGWRAARD